MAGEKPKKESEDTLDSLDYLTGDPVNFWEKKQRELVTSEPLVTPISFC
jgi:hypothetical protein